MLVRVLRRWAATQGDPLTVLTALAGELAPLVLGGDEFATNISKGEGTSTTWMREMPASQLAQLVETAIAQLEAGNDAPDPTLRGLDFSAQPSYLG